MGALSAEDSHRCWTGAIYADFGEFPKDKDEVRRILLLGNPVNNLLARFSRKVHRAFIGLNYAVDDAAAGKEAELG